MPLPDESNKSFLPLLIPLTFISCVQEKMRKTLMKKTVFLTILCLLFTFSRAAAESIVEAAKKGDIKTVKNIQENDPSQLNVKN
jgi:hypothetical protein